MIQTLSTSFSTGRVSRGDGTMAPPDRPGDGMEFSVDVIERYSEYAGAAILLRPADLLQLGIHITKAGEQLNGSMVQ